MRAPELTPREASQWFRYEPETGRLYWNKSPKYSTIKPGDEAGSSHNKGYRSVCVGGRREMAHRVAFLLYYGEWPREEIDHINGIRSDNRLENLREATKSENLRNMRRKITNKSGFKGVYKVEYKGNVKWRAAIRVSGKTVSLGRFNTPEEAHAVYSESARKHFGEFARAS